jgi:hypothetical protein
MRNLYLLLALILGFTAFSDLNAQYTDCTGTLNVINLDISNLQDGESLDTVFNVANSMPVCCNHTTNPANSGCIFINLTLSGDALGVDFGFTGATGGPTLYYGNCTRLPNDRICLDPARAVFDPVTGNQTHSFMFCRSGANPYDVNISQINPSGPGSVIVSDGCEANVSATGLIESTVTWTSIFPGTEGDYDYLLDCEVACLDNVVRYQDSAPDLVRYRVCGNINSPCGDLIVYCAEFEVTFVTDLIAQITPIQPSICAGGDPVTLTANGINGAPPYSYLWSTGATTQSIVVSTPGPYTVTITDDQNCAPAEDSVFVLEYLSDIVVDAGDDITVCGTPLPDVQLNGSSPITGTGQWVGGAGTFTPDRQALNATYTPTLAEITAGSVVLTLESTNNG